MNLLDNVKGVLTDALIGKAANMLGMSSSDTSSAVSKFLPAILGGVINKGSSRSGAQSILDLISKGGYKEDNLKDLGSILGDSNRSKSFLEQGAGLLGSLFGSRQSGVLDMLLKLTGIKKSSGSMLMSLLAPIVMNKLSGLISKNKYDAAGLSSYLGSQKSSVFGALPGLSSLFDADEAAKKVAASTSGSSSSHSSERSSSYTTSTSTTTSTSSRESGGGGGGFLKWLLPLLLAAGALWWFSKQGCAKKDTAKVDTHVENKSDMGKTEDKASNKMKIEGAKDKKDEHAGGETTRSTTHQKDMTGGAESGMLKNFKVDANGNIVGADGTILVPSGKYGLDKSGNLLDNNGKVIARAGSFSPAILDGLKAQLGTYAMTKLSVNANGDLVDETGKVLVKASDLVQKDGFYYDKKGTKLGKIWGAIKKAVGKTADAMASLFTKMIKKEAGVKTDYTLSNVVFNKENHRITNFSKAEVEGLAQALKANPKGKVTVAVYTNDGKNEKESKKISEKRANVIHDMLVTLGVPKGQISFEGKGRSDAAKAAGHKVDIIVK